MVVMFVLSSLVGLLLIYIGYTVWKKKEIAFLYEYYCDKVSDKNKAAFCTLAGLGIAAIGGGSILMALLMLITNSLWSIAAYVVGLLVGLALLIYATRTYNR